MNKRTKHILKLRHIVAIEKTLALYRESVAMQRESLEIAKQNLAYARTISAISRRNLMDRLLAEGRQLNLEDEAP